MSKIIPFDTARKLEMDWALSNMRGLDESARKLGLYAEASRTSPLSDWEDTIKLIMTLAKTVHQRNLCARDNELNKKVAELLRQFPKNVCRFQSMFLEYNNMIMDNDELTEVRYPEAGLNVIDAQALMKDMMHGKYDRGGELRAKLDRFVTTNGVSSLIPCFTSGQMKLVPGKGLFWTVHELDLEKDELEVSYSVYSEVTIKSGTYRIPDGYCRVRYIPDTDPVDDGDDLGTTKYLIKPIFLPISMVEFYKSYNPKRFRNWDKRDRFAWSKYFGDIVSWFDANTGDDSTSMVAGVTYWLNYLLFLTPAINMILSEKRAKVTKTEPKPKPEVVKNFDPKAHSARRIREVDGITITSNTIPRACTRANVIKYRVASWQVRGHWREYKSGKRVYIEPHTATRQCMEKEHKEKSPAPVSIVMK